MAHENATPAELAVLYVLVEQLGGHSVTMVSREKDRRLGFSMGRSRTVAVPDVVAAAADTLRAENERLTSKVSDLEADLHDEETRVRHYRELSEGLREALESAEYALTRSPLREAEAISEAKRIVRAALSEPAQ